MTDIKFVQARKAGPLPAVVARRNKLIRGIWEQMEAAKAAAGGQPYAPMVVRNVRGDDGIRRSVEVPKRIRPWHWTGEDGKTYLSLRYGTRELSMDKGANAVAIPKPQDLLPTLAALKDMAAAGEFDAAIVAASAIPTLEFPVKP